MASCQFVELEHAPGVYSCKVCGVHTTPGIKFDRAPFRQCPYDPIGRRGMRMLRASAGSLPEPPEGLEEDLGELDIEPENEQSLALLYARWRLAIDRWREEGKPKRTDAEVAECLSICAGDEQQGRPPCSNYSKRLGVLGYCTLCGCQVNGSAIGELNKVRMATEYCPVFKWPPNQYTPSDDGSKSA